MLDGDLPDVPVNVVVPVVKGKKFLFAGTDDGVYVSYTDGAHWSKYGNGLPNCCVIDLKVNVAQNRLVYVIFSALHDCLDIWPVDRDLSVFMYEARAQVMKKLVAPVGDATLTPTSRMGTARSAALARSGRGRPMTGRSTTAARTSTRPPSTG